MVLDRITTVILSKYDVEFEGTATSSGIRHGCSTGIRLLQLNRSQAGMCFIGAVSKVFKIKTKEGNLMDSFDELMCLTTINISIQKSTLQLADRRSVQLISHTSLICIQGHEALIARGPSCVAHAVICAFVPFSNGDEAA